MMCIKLLLLLHCSLKTRSNRQAETENLALIVGPDYTEFGKGSDATSFPKLDPDASLEVFYAEVPVSGLAIMKVMDQYHSGLTFKYEDKDHKKKMWTVQLYAKDGIRSAVCPKLDSKALPIWNDTVVVAFRKDGTINKAPEMYLRETFLGSINGSVFNDAYHAFVARYLEEHSTYQLFDVISSDKLPHCHKNSKVDSTRPMKSATCDSFSEASIDFLVANGLVTSLASQTMVYRNYAFIVAASNNQPEEVDRSNPEAMEFYGMLVGLCEANLISIMSVYDLFKAKNAFVQLNGRYYKFVLGKKKFALGYHGKYLMRYKVA